MATIPIAKMPRAAKSVVPWWAAGILVVLLAALRLNPEGFRGGPFIRALVVRGLFFAAVGAITAGAGALLVRRVSTKRQIISDCPPS